MVLPGLTKYTARLLLYDREERSLHRVRDLVHTKVWVVWGSHRGGARGQPGRPLPGPRLAGADSLAGQAGHTPPHDEGPGRHGRLPSSQVSSRLPPLRQNRSGGLEDGG